jgi:hypothetical protein
MAQRNWYRRTPNQTSTANQTTEIANPTAGIYWGHLSTIFAKADLIERIDYNPSVEHKMDFKTRHSEL